MFEILKLRCSGCTRYRHVYSMEIATHKIHICRACLRRLKAQVDGMLEYLDKYDKN
jgi:ribosomal protein S14